MNQWMTKNEFIHSVGKITEKVSFNIASEASYIYILSWHKLIKIAKNCQLMIETRS